MTKKLIVRRDGPSGSDGGARPARHDAIRKTEPVRTLERTGPPVQLRQETDRAVDPERLRRVEELRAQVRAGRYRPDIRDVAMGLIRDDLSPFS